MRTILSLVLLSTAIFSSAESPPPELKPFKMEVFAQTFKPIKAKADGTIALKKCTSANDKALDLWCYQVDTKIKIAEVHQLAKFKDNGDSIQPWFMQQDDRAFWSKTHQQVSFDYDNQIISTLYDKSSKTQTFNSPIFDEASYPMQIRKHLLNETNKFTLDLITGHKVKTTHFEIIGKATLFTTAGILETIKVEQTQGSSKVIIWFAKRWDYLPVQFETYKSNKLRSRVTVTSITF